MAQFNFSPYDARQQELDQQRAYAEALRQQGLEAPQGQMAGRAFVGPSWTQGLAQMLKAYGGRKGVEMANEKSQAMAQERTQAMVDALRGYGAGGKPEALLENPDTAALGVSEMGANRRYKQQMERDAITRRQQEDMQRRRDEQAMLRLQAQQEAADRRAEAANASRMAAAQVGGGGSAPASLQEWEAFQRMTPEQQQLYLTMKRANPYLNLGGEQVQMNPAAPGERLDTQLVTPKPEQLPEFKAEVASAVEQGRAAGAAAAAAPTKNVERDRLIADLKEVREMPGFRSIFGTVQGRTPDLTQSARDARARVNDIIANLSLEGRQKLQGGGSVSDFEGRLLAQAATLLADPTISDELAVKEVDKLIGELEAAKTWGGGAGAQAGAPGTWAPPSAGWTIKRKEGQ